MSVLTDFVLVRVLLCLDFLHSVHWEYLFLSTYRLALEFSSSFVVLENVTCIIGQLKLTLQLPRKTTTLIFNVVLLETAANCMPAGIKQTIFLQFFFLLFSELGGITKHFNFFPMT